MKRKWEEIPCEVHEDGTRLVFKSPVLLEDDDIINVDFTKGKAKIFRKKDRSHFTTPLSAFKAGLLK